MLWIAATGLLVRTCFASTYTALFVDSHDVLYTAGLQRQLQPLVRVTPGVAAVKPDKPWEHLIAYTSVAKVEDEFHMWYQCSDGGSSCQICYATSKDGLTWTKPALTQHAYGNETKTNIVLREESAAGAGGLYFGDVLYDPEEKNTSRRFKMVLFDRPLVPGEPHGAQVPGIWPVYSDSPTGPWHRPPLSDGPLLVAAYGGAPQTQPPYADQQCDDFRAGPCGEAGQWISPLAPSDVLNLLWDPKTRSYRCYHKTWIDGIDGKQFWKRAVGLSTSQDFDHWDLTRQLIIYPDEFDGPETAYLPGVGNVGVELHGGPTFYHATADVYFMLAEVLDWKSEPTGDLRCELAVARGAGAAGDWTRPFQQGKKGAKYFFDLNPTPKLFDSGVLWMSGNPQTIGNTTYFYYGAYAAWNADVDKKFCTSQATCSGVGIASMPVDRFVALQPLNAKYPAQVTTKPLLLSPSSCLTANVDARSGSVRVELLTTSGYRVHGYEAANATAITSNNVAAVVKWNSAAAPPAPGRYSARVHFTGDAQLFALSVHTPCQPHLGDLWYI